MSLIRRRNLLGALALAGLAALGCGPSCNCSGPLPEAAPVTVYIVRHAEKQVMPPDAPDAQRQDPPLSRAGQIRALGLAQDIPIRAIEAVYLTDTQRARDTASAVLALKGITPIIYPGHDVAGLAARLRQRSGQSALVVGHSNTIPPLLTALGVEPVVELSDDQYGDLWVVTLSARETKLEQRRFGETVERFNPGPAAPPPS